MAKMLRHKETGELFIWTDPLSKLAELEPVIEDPVAEVIAEMAAQDTVEAPVASMVEVVDAPDFVETPVAEDVVETPVAEVPKVSVVKAASQKRSRT